MSEIKPIKNIHIPGVEKVKPQQRTGRTAPKQSFKDILASKLNYPLKFSGHALARIQRREIVMDEAKLDKLRSAVDLADKKGARSSLVLMDDLALIVSIKNRTVITAIDGKHIKENVFTNIDSAVIV